MVGKLKDMRRAAVRPLMVALGAALVGLTGCSSKPARVDDAASAAGVTSQGASGVHCHPAPRRGGGAYYLDDGPGDCIPVDLENLPDAVPRIEALHAPALRPYTVMGQNFVPRTALTPYRERGHGSWYGRRFHGNPTSIGEPYDMFAMTAAHPTLPIPSYARVTNLANGRTVVVRVNDRGPFLRGRLIDLSYAAAYRLGYVNSGSALVEVESILPDEIRLAQATGGGATAGPRPVVRAPAAVVSSASAPASNPEVGGVSPAVVMAPLAPLAPPVAASPAPELQVGEPARAPLVALAPTSQAKDATPSLTPQTVAPSGGAFLQLGAFATPANAEGLVGRVRSELGLLAERLHLLNEGGRYRLQLGPFASADEARQEAGRIGALLNLQPFVVVR